jgi:transposase InsO family protein
MELDPGIHIVMHSVLSLKPGVTISDHGTQFVARFWEQLQESLGTKLIQSSAYHPQTDGQTERVNQILKTCLELVSFIMIRIGTNAYL